MDVENNRDKIIRGSTEAIYSAKSRASRYSLAHRV